MAIPDFCVAPFFVANNGTLSCSKHGGAYLRGEVNANPRKQVIVTPLDHWERLTKTDLEYLESKDIPACQGDPRKVSR